MTELPAAHRRLRILVISVAIIAAFTLFLAAGLSYGTLKSAMGLAMPDGDFRSLNPGNVLAFRGLFLIGGLLCGWIAFIVATRAFSIRHWLADRRAELARLGSALRPQKDEVQFIAVLALLAGLGLAIRLPHLWAPLHHDQAYTVTVFAPRLWTALTDYHVPNNHVFHTVLVHFAISLFGIQPWAVRLPALFAGILMIPATYWLGRAVYDRYTGLMAALLVTVAPREIFYTTIARGYAILGLITLLIFWLGDFVRKDKNGLAWFLVALVSALGFWTIPIMLLPFGMLFTWLIVENWAAGGGPYGSRLNFSKYWLAAGFGAISLTFLLYSPLFIFTGFWKVVTNDFHFPLDQLLSMAQRHLAAFTEWSLGAPEWLLVFLAAGLFLSLIFHRRLSSHRFPMQLAGLIWFLVVLVLVRPLPWTRIWFFLMAPVLIWCSAGTAGLLRNLRIKRARGLPVAAVLIAVSMIYPLGSSWQALLSLSQVQTTIGRDEAAVLFIDQRLQENDLILAPSPQNAVIWYYGRLHGIQDQHFDPEYPHQRVFLLTQPAQGQRVADLLERYDLTDADWSSPRLLQDFRGLEIFVIEKR